MSVDFFPSSSFAIPKQTKKKSILPVLTLQFEYHMIMKVLHAKHEVRYDVLKTLSERDPFFVLYQKKILSVRSFISLAARLLEESLNFHESSIFIQTRTEITLF